MSENASGLSCAKHVILVLSGKGGVGKSTVAVHLALKLQKMGKKVGLLDIDLCGPSIPFMLNLSDHDVHQSEDGWLPVFTDSSQTLGVMSLAFLLNNKNDAVVWRGPKKTAMIRQFVNDVVWQDIDYLIIDTPPGTSDEHVAVMENLKSCKVDGAILVTTPQAVSVNDVRREATFCKKVGIQLLGIVENMSGFMCPTCQECTNIFSQGGGEKLANYIGTTFLGRIPLDMALSYLVERKLSSIEDFNNSPVSKTIEDITKLILSKTEQTLQ